MCPSGKIGARRRVPRRHEFLGFGRNIHRLSPLSLFVGDHEARLLQFRHKLIGDYAPEIERFLSTAPSLTGTQIYRKLRERGYQGSVDVVDLATLSKYYGATGLAVGDAASCCDLNGDGKVDDDDITLFFLGF